MSKLKITIATLAILGSSALINCSEFQGNHSTPGAGPALNSEAPADNSAAEQAALLFQQKMEYRAALKTDLQALSRYSFPEDQCSQTNLLALVNQQEVINTGSRTLTFDPPLSRIKDQTQTVQQVQFSVAALVRSLQAASNHYCSLNIVADAAKFAISDFMENPEINMSMDTSEAETQRLNQYFEKADHVRNGLKTLAAELQTRVNADIRLSWTEMASEHESLREQIGSKIQMLGQLIELVRSSYTCDDSSGTVVNCSQQELARGASVVNTDNIINQAQSTLAEFQISEPGDARLTEARVENLRNHLHQLTIRENVMKSIVQAVETQQNSAADQAEVEQAQSLPVIQSGKPQ